MFNLNDHRVKAVHEQAMLLVTYQPKLKDAANYLEEAVEYREFFNSWYGEHSKEFQLANSVVILLRMLRTSTSSAESLKDWISEQPLRLSWFLKLENVLQTELEAIN